MMPSYVIYTHIQARSGIKILRLRAKMKSSQGEYTQRCSRVKLTHPPRAISRQAIGGVKLQLNSMIRSCHFPDKFVCITYMGHAGLRKKHTHICAAVCTFLYTTCEKHVVVPCFDFWKDEGEGAPFHGTPAFFQSKRVCIPSAQRSLFGQLQDKLDRILSLLCS